MKTKTTRPLNKATSILLAGLTVVMAASLLAVLPEAASATTPTALTFSGTRHVVSVTYRGVGASFDVLTEGTVDASGAINGSFGLVDQAAVIQMSPQTTHFGTIHINSVLTSLVDPLDTITMDIQGQFVSANPDGTETVHGHWAIISGTGSYTDLHGSGSYDDTTDTTTETITSTLTGFAFYPGS